MRLVTFIRPFGYVPSKEVSLPNAQGYVFNVTGEPVDLTDFAGHGDECFELAITYGFAVSDDIEVVEITDDEDDQEAGEEPEA